MASNQLSDISLLDKSTCIIGYPWAFVRTPTKSDYHGAFAEQVGEWWRKRQLLGVRGLHGSGLDAGSRAATPSRGEQVRASRVVAPTCPYLLELSWLSSGARTRGGAAKAYPAH
jgi:hypothetical protein